MPVDEFMEHLTADQFLTMSTPARPMSYYEMQGESIRRMRMRWVQPLLEEIYRYRLTPDEIWAEILKPHARSTEIDMRMEEIYRQYREEHYMDFLNSEVCSIIIDRKKERRG